MRVFFLLVPVSEMRGAEAARASSQKSQTKQERTEIRRLLSALVGPVIKQGRQRRDGEELFFAMGLGGGPTCTAVEETGEDVVRCMGVEHRHKGES